MQSDEVSPQRGAEALTRRQIGVGAGILGLFAALGLPVVTGGRADDFELGLSQAFDFAWLRGTAKRLAEQPYEAPQVRYSEVLDQIDYDAYQQIRPRPERSLWQHGGAAFPAQLFHLGRFFKLPVKIHVVVEGESREVMYSPEYFEFGDTGLAKELPSDLGFAGFRIMDEDTGGPLHLEGTIDITGMGEAVVLAGPRELTLELEDGRRLPFTLTSTTGRIQVSPAPGS